MSRPRTHIHRDDMVEVISGNHKGSTGRVLQVIAPPVDFTNFVWFGSQGILTVLGAAAVISFLVYFLLAAGELFKRKFVRLAGEKLSQRRITLQVIEQIGDRVAKSLLHLAFASILVGIATWGMLSWFGVRYAGLWGLAA